MSRSVVLDLNAQIYETGGIFFGKWKDCRIILYSDSRLDWFFDQTKLAGSLFLKDLKNLISFDGVTASAPQSRPFVPKIIRANLLFSVATDKAGKYYHWFLFDSKDDYNKFCNAVCLQIEKTRISKKARSPSVEPSKRKPRSTSVIPNKLRFLRGLNGSQEGSDSETSSSGRRIIGGRVYGSATPNPIRRILGNQTNANSSVDAMLDKM